MTKIGYTTAEGVALIELHDPPANTYSYEMMQELDAAILAARMDAAVHVIVLTGSGEKFFNKTSPQTINGTNLPPQFDPAKFPVPGGISVPLGSFGEGTYRLAIKVSDKVSGKTITHDVPFTVKAAS